MLPFLIALTLSTPTYEYYFNSGFTFPEVIDNRARINPGDGYFYPQQTENIINPPNEALQTYILPKTVQDTNIKIINISCVDTLKIKSFIAQIETIKYFDNPPIIEDASRDCISGHGNTFNMNFEGIKMLQCGVRRCGNGDLCLKLRFATIKGLRMVDDFGVVLLCKPQEIVTSQVRSLKFNPRIVQGRALNPIASGGTQRNFNSEVSLYRKVPQIGGFSLETVVPGTSVQLGEDLLLRAVVRDGDGWTSSRMGSVVIQKASLSETETSKSRITLVDENGCRPRSIKSICPENPVSINPLTNELHFKAFTFQDSKAGEELILSVRMFGCVQYEDCVQPESSRCDIETKVRSKRETENGTRTDSMGDWNSYLEFRVVEDEGGKKWSKSRTEIEPPRDLLQATKSVVIESDLVMIILIIVSSIGIAFGTIGIVIFIKIKSRI